MTEGCWKEWFELSDCLAWSMTRQFIFLLCLSMTWMLTFEQINVPAVSLCSIFIFKIFAYSIFLAWTWTKKPLKILSPSISQSSFSTLSDKICHTPKTDFKLHCICSIALHCIPLYFPDFPSSVFFPSLCVSVRVKMLASGLWSCWMSREVSWYGENTKHSVTSVLTFICSPTIPLLQLLYAM